MKPNQTIDVSIIVVMFAVIGLALMLIHSETSAGAQELPFSVYETESACVYVTGYSNATPAIAVMPKFYKQNGAKC